MQAQQYYRPADVVKAVQNTDASAFVNEFNSGRTSYPLAMDSGASGVFVISSAGSPTAIAPNSWVVRNGSGVQIYGDADFKAKFTQVS